MTGEASEGTNRREGRESEEDDDTDERVDRALDELEEREGKERQSVDDKVDEFLDELEENERDAKEVDDKVNEALDDIEETENQERDGSDVLDSMEDARDDLHRDFVHDMHEQCPASEAFSEEARKYYESSEASEDTDSDEGSEVNSETGDGTVQVLEKEGESGSSSEEASETESPDSAKELPDEDETIEKADASSTMEQHQEVDESEQHPDESVESREPQSRQENSEETEPAHRARVEGDEVTESRRRSVEQSTFDEFEDAEASGDASEDLRTESTDSSEESEERRVEEIERNIEDTENPDAQEATETTSDPEKAEGDTDTNSEVSHDSHDEAGAFADREGPEDTMHSTEGGESYETGEEQQESVSEIGATQEPEHVSHSREEGATEAQEAEEVVVDSEEDQTESLEDESEIEEWQMPSMLPENYSFDIFPETEEENFRPALLSETIQGIWESLSDDEREEIRPFLREDIETTEDLEDALERSPSVRYSSDFEEDLEDVRAYLLLTGEDRALAETPRLLERLMSLEAKRRWAELLLAQSVESVLDDSNPTESESEPEQGSRAKPREVRLHEPSIAGHAGRDIRTVRRLLKKHYPGMLERSDIDSLLKQVEDHLRLIARLSGRTTVSHRELAIISKELGIKKGNSYDWVLRGQVPNFYKILEQALSKEAAAAVLDKIRELLGSITSWTDVEAQLEEMYPGGEYKQGFRYDVRKQRVKDFFKYIAELAKSGTTKGIARRAGIKIRVARAFSDGELPWLIRHVVGYENETKPNKLLFRIAIKEPILRRIMVKSFASFKRMVDRDFPWFQERDDYERLMDTVRAFYKVSRKWRSKGFVSRQEVVTISKELGISDETIMDWIKGKALPMAFDLLERSLSVSEAKSEVQKILAELNGVTTWTELMKRLKTLYLLDDVKGLPSYNLDTLHAKKFFRYVTALAKGGLLTDIAQRAGIDLPTARRHRHQKGFPRLVNVAIAIPAERPRRGYKWIPLWTDERGQMRDFIQVPAIIRGIKDILRVIAQLTSRKGKSMAAWRKRFGELEPLDAFMYLLGAIASDGTVGRKEGTSTRLGISLSKKYSWSEAFGEAYCYYFGLFGFKAGREQDSISPGKNGKVSEMMNWGSKYSPFLIWLLRTALGLDRSRAKSRQSIHANWILKMSKDARIAFLQGLADGDGYCSVRYQKSGIGTKMNKGFVRQLLASLDIKSRPSGTGVIMYHKDALRKLGKLPMFRYARGRSFRLFELNKMLDSMKWTRMSREEEAIILGLYEIGFNFGQISSILWSEHGIARRVKTIENATKRLNDQPSK